MQVVDVDAYVIGVDVLEVGVLGGVELDSEEVIARVAVVLDVEEGQVPGGERGGEEARVRGHHEGHAVGAEVGVVGDDGEHEGGREGRHLVVVAARRRA